MDTSAVTQNVFELRVDCKRSFRLHSPLDKDLKIFPFKLFMMSAGLVEGMGNGVEGGRWSEKISDINNDKREFPYCATFQLLSRRGVALPRGHC